MDDLTETGATTKSSQETAGKDVECPVPGEERVAGQVPVVDGPADQEDWFESVSREQSPETRRQCCQMTYFGSDG